MKRYLLLVICVFCLAVLTPTFAKAKKISAKKNVTLPMRTTTNFVPRDDMEYLLLATNKTSSMQKEMNEAGTEGYRFEGAMGGQTANGGNEAVVIMGRPKGGKTTDSFQYKLLATNKTSTMQKEVNQAATAGFIYKGQSVFETAFGGKEVVVIMELDKDEGRQEEYQLLATTRTSSMQKEMNQVAAQGFTFCGITVSETAFGGKELVVIMRRQK